MPDGRSRRASPFRRMPTPGSMPCASGWRARIPPPPMSPRSSCRAAGRGGRALSLSGDTLTVRVTFDPTLSVMESRKIVFADDPRWLGPGRWGESWHSDDRMPGGSYRRLGMPPWEVHGMSFKGMIDDGTSASFKPYTVMAPDHFLLRQPHEVPVTAAGTIGERSLNGLGGASGYEFDANLDQTRLGPGPLPGVTTLASVLDQPNLEWLGDPNRGADLIY